MRRRRWLALVLCGVLGGCAGAEQEGRASAVKSLVDKATDDGAKRCAPYELAMAESHLAFAETEFSEGDYYRAKEELDVSEKNAHLAVKKSPKERCNPQVAVVKPQQPPPQKMVVVERLDTDQDGLFDDEDKCPEEPEDKDGYQDDDGCPDPDNDADGIADADDKCPLDPEDKDGFQDDDGCPDLDNDADGLADKVDQCPNDPEDKDGFQDDDGCPDPDNDQDGVADANDKCPMDPGPGTPDGCPQKYKLVVVTSTKIELKQTIFFDFNKAKIKKVSYALLDDVAQALKDHPDLKVRIEGHTDGVGGKKFNMKLSQKRAESVKKYLVKKGIDADRMTPKGYGDTQPIADNRTEEGRSQNRRVEFIILNNDDSGSPAGTDNATPSQP